MFSNFACKWRCCFSSKLSAAGAKRGVLNIPMRRVPSRQSTYDDHYHDYDDDDNTQGASGRRHSELEAVANPLDDDDDNNDDTDD